jgi:biopolymer transport protein ExbB
MKRLFSILAITGLMTFGNVQAQDSTQTEEVATEQVQETAADETAAVATEEEAAAEPTFTQKMKTRFIEGGPAFMGIVLICLILGLAIAIERIIYLNLSTTNTKKLISDVEDALKSGGVDAAKEVCRNTAGPVASIFYQGLDRHSHGIDSAEKAVVLYVSH